MCGRKATPTDLCAEVACIFAGITVTKPPIMQALAKSFA
jgi:hypothetical protein